MRFLLIVDLSGLANTGIFVMARKCTIHVKITISTTVAWFAQGELLMIANDSAQDNLPFLRLFFLCPQKSLIRPNMSVGMTQYDH
jgi:hypothetical protein